MKSIGPWSFLIFAAVAASAALSIAFEGWQASRSALRYIGIWETEIARSLLMHERPDEVAKLLAQIEEFHPALRMQAEGTECRWPVRRTISLYALPATDVVVCRDPAALVQQALLSPFFFGLLLVAGALVLISLRREHRQELLRLAAEARAESESRLGRLSREVAHDIRGPLSALQMLASKASAMPAAEKDLLLQASSRIGAIADDLLNRSRKSETAATAGSVDALLSSMRTELERRFANHRLDFSLQAPGASIADGSGFLRVVSNLVQNAADASPASSTILLATRESADAFSVIVSDEGKGIAPELLVKLGREEVSAGKSGGNGLGVLSAKRVTETMGGILTIRSKEGVGTQVELRFPR